MYHIVGLGNPGSKYLLTRHNIGFMSLDHLAYRHNFSYKSKWESEYLKANLNSEDFILQKPLTFMNLSGSSVIKAIQFFKIKTDNLLVVQDDIDMPFGAIRFQKNRSAGGHNGIKDITQKLGTQDYCRLKIGVDRPSRGSTESHVLQNFSKTEQDKMPELLNDVSDSIEFFLKEGLDKAANKFNRKNFPEI